jgi:predicted DNA-binding antitoxin AbrB/MazE fold protein
MHEPIEVIYENGVFRPLGPLPGDLQESGRYRVTLEAPGSALEGRLDPAFVAAAKQGADPTVSLEEMRRILAKVPGSLAQAVVAEREER